MLSAATAVFAQAPRVRRTEFVTYDTRQDASKGDRSKTARHIVVAPASDGVQEGVEFFTQKFATDASWGDYNAYLHLANVGSAYTLVVNDRIVADVEDDRSPAEFMISPYLKQGENTLTLALRESRTPQLQEGVPASKQKRFDGSYIFAQRKLHIDDFSAEIVPDATEKYGILHLEVVVENAFNFEETISVGYDIYSPAGKLIDYAVRDLTVAGRSRDTLRITTDIYDAYKNKWGGNKGDAPLYSVMLYTKRNGLIYEYIPFKVGFGKSELAEQRLIRFDMPVEMLRSRYNAAADAATAQREIATLKREGINTLVPDFPQPEWFYDLCDRMGMYVIDRAAINAPTARGDRGVGGTPSNDPAMLDEYLSRIDAMYFRMRNHPCVAGFMLGGEAGNGYTMYKAYRYLKSLEPSRPVIYEDAHGEWNTDL